jgi:hypothetical protein
MTPDSNPHLAKVRKPMLAIAAAALLAGCTPTVKVATDEPITINLNVNIKHEILVKVDKELDDLFADDELF